MGCAVDPHSLAWGWACLLYNGGCRVHEGLCPSRDFLEWTGSPPFLSSSPKEQPEEGRMDKGLEKVSCAGAPGKLSATGSGSGGSITPTVARSPREEGKEAPWASASPPSPARAPRLSVCLLSLQCPPRSPTRARPARQTHRPLRGTSCRQGLGPSDPQGDGAGGVGQPQGDGWGRPRPPPVTAPPLRAPLPKPYQVPPHLSLMIPRAVVRFLTDGECNNSQ